MKKYDIEITETLQKTISVEAETPEDALFKVMDDYKAGGIVLGGDDMVGDASFAQVFGREDTRQPYRSQPNHQASHQHHRIGIERDER